MTINATNIGQRVSARWAYPHDLSAVHVEGRMIGYSDRPQALIMTDDGQHVWWGAELTMPVEMTLEDRITKALAPLGPDAKHFAQRVMEAIEETE